jgi:plastocyanin
MGRPVPSTAGTCYVSRGLRCATAAAARVLAGATLLVGGLALPAGAGDAAVTISIANGKFVPSEVPVPAGQKVKLVVRNQDRAMSEFESTEFHREKIVGPGKEITLFVGPLDAGRYEFFDDFHPENRGHLVAK